MTFSQTVQASQLEWPLLLSVVDWGGAVDWVTVGATVAVLTGGVLLQRVCLWCRLQKLQSRIRPRKPPRWATKTRATHAGSVGSVDSVGSVAAGGSGGAGGAGGSEGTGAKQDGAGQTGFTPGGVSWT